MVPDVPADDPPKADDLTRTAQQQTEFADAIPTPDRPPGPLAELVRVAGYTVVRELGRGGMGVVYLARQQSPGRQVALKMVLAGASAGPDLLNRFRLEGEAIARISHPGIVQVFDCGQAGSVPYLALEYIDGPSLERTPMPMEPRPAAELLVKVARAVEFAHGKGVVHRDLKPANILLTAAGEPKVTDFGLAKFDPALAPTLNDLNATTRSGAILGSPRYMAPEQAAGRVADIGPATDVHALGLILYELLTGAPAFVGDTLLDTLDKVRTSTPVAVRMKAPGVPRDLETICEKCLAKAPAKRYARAEDLADDLQRWLNGEPIHARPTPPWERVAKWARRNPDDALVRGIICFLLPPCAFAVVQGAPALALASMANVALGAAVVLRHRWWVRAVILAGCVAAGVLEFIYIPWMALFAYRYFALGALCGVTGRVAARRWGGDPAAVTGVSLLCASCGLLLVAVPSMVTGVWGTSGSLWASTGTFAAGGIAGGAWFARQMGKRGSQS